jgi:N-acetylglucosaminyldiphosphoundecaprenol N-acetyl-beta-D-mannosaminyltransferase
MKTQKPSGSAVSNLPDLERRYVIGQRLDATSYRDATQRIVNWAQRGESRYVCVSNVHMVMEGRDATSFRALVNESDLVTADGVPLVWCLRALGVASASRVYGPSLTLHVCEAAAVEGIPIALYGGTEESLQRFVHFLERRFPMIDIVCAIAPPFRSIDRKEDDVYMGKIAESGAKILFVGIGCPKQEKWMASHCGRLDVTMIGVGAAFDFHTGNVRQAPAWMQQIGMEWFFRFMMEPKRLWKRYAWHNPRFVLFFGLQYLKYLISAKSS